MVREVVILNPSTACSMDIFSREFVVKIVLMCEKTENKQKEAGDGQLKTKLTAYNIP